MGDVGQSSPEALSHGFSCLRSSPEGGAGVQILWSSCEEHGDMKCGPQAGLPKVDRIEKDKIINRRNEFQDPLLLWISQKSQPKISPVMKQIYPVIQILRA